MTGKKVVLLSCGSFNPPTNMHLRMFELARDHLQKLGFEVLLGLVSPVHDGYGKEGLLSATHRISMLKLALQDSDWIKLSDWESCQENHTRTAVVLKYHQNHINNIINNKLNDNVNEQDFPWFLNDLQSLPGAINNIQVKLLCGADLLESFGTPGLWANEDIEDIVGNHGLVVVTRENSNPHQFIYMSDVLTKYMTNIIVVNEWIRNDVSSTKIRRALKRNESVKYLIPDKVIDYIRRHEIFGWSNKNKYLLPPIPTQNNLLTPSPVDISMDSPSPTNLNCMSICNNNLFSSNRPASESYPPIDSNVNKNNILNSFKHPGQAVQIITDSFGDHKIVKNRQDAVKDNEVRAAGDQSTLKSSRSCTNFDKLDTRWSLQGSKSNDDLKGYKNCDENLIKFIFTKHGIQVISDIETIV
ncbi:Cytidylyltransferase-like [Popillia japonica]|uniref:Nicotinamide-nucleotide adenylyltransferase n=1 Tax=Popillia japonica TaxID=7064 RepID=A0AAW1KJ63_POPJA